ncbi:MAG: O-methyltransferase [bacterium]|nr:O-methyltransferase [Candidatus Kapabacteria bacterium]
MKGTPLTDGIVDYINELFPSEEDVLRTLKKDALEADIPAIQISPEQGAYMQVMLRAMSAKRVIEIGTLAGYSSILMARALPDDGELVTLEVNPFHAQFATERIAEAGLAHKVRVLTGSALDLLERDLAGSGPYDFAFIDADKPAYTRYLDLLLPLMRRGGVIAGDNAMAWGEIANPATEDPSVKGMQAFNRAMAAETRLQSCLVPIGDGMCMGVVL